MHCHFSIKDLAYFAILVIPCFLVGAEAISRIGEVYLYPWISFMVFFFGLIEMRVLCTHCPHYAEPGSVLCCWANIGSPKIWKFRPGPMTLVEKVVMLTGFALIWGYPLIFLVLIRALFLLALFILTSLGFYLTMRRFFCTQCMNFACPFNRVDEDIRQAFFDRNHLIRSGWYQRELE